MLPSTGHFNVINCPFYDNGLCDRPYCHFRHVKKNLQNTVNDGIESGTIPQKLLSVEGPTSLQHTEGVPTPQPAAANPTDTNERVVAQPHKATYNPTPISELKKINNTDAENIEDINGQPKRHIPIPHTPFKPVSIPIKRPTDTNGATKLIYLPPPQEYKPGSVENVVVDKYTPTGTGQEATSKRNYVPSSDLSHSKKKILEYEPPKLSRKSNKPVVTYQPTPRSLAPCFSSDEEEPVTKKSKMSNDINDEPDTDTSKISNDMNILDGLETELDMMGEIIDDENKSPEDFEIKADNEDIVLKTDTKHKDSKQENGDTLKTKKVKDKKSHKIKSDRNDKEKKSTSDKHKKEEKHKTNIEKTDKMNSEKINKKHSEKTNRINSEKTNRINSEKTDKINSEKTNKINSEKTNKINSEKKTSHKSSSRDRDKDKERKDSKDRHSSDKKKHSLKSSQDSSKSKSQDRSSKKSEKHSSSRSKEKSSRDKHHKSSKHDKDKKERNKNKNSPKPELSDDDHFIDNENGHNDESNLSDTDEDSITEQCKKIFDEYNPVKPDIQEEKVKTEDIVEEEYIPGKKRISRTTDKNIKIISKAPLKPDFKVSAAQAMAERLAKVREFHNSRQPAPAPVTPVLNEVPKTPNSKVRIAYVPYASTMLKAKKIVPPPKSEAKSQPSTSTISQTIPKGQQRVAHVPSEKFIDRPGVLEPLASKIPANTRSLYLNKMIDECLKLYITPTDAYARAQYEELNTSKKCSTIKIYQNSASVTVSRLRRELQECNGVKKSSFDCSVLGKGITSGNSINAGSWSIEKKQVVNNSQEFVGPKLYRNIVKWVLTEEQLHENGFPRPHSSGEKGKAIIYGQNKQRPPKGFVRTCCRCKKDYTVNKEGFPVSNEECIYHPNNKYRVRGEARYQCCSQDATSDGCCVAPNHVYEYVDFENLKGYIRTLPPERQLDDYGVYSLDCEMCYTTRGLDLTRVTVIDSSCKVIYETLVKPSKPIIDYNTRYSGITEEQMANVKTSLIEVQATLLAMFNSKTILVGHSLESDFKALKLIHDTVIDTSVLYPHKMGPPYKRALRNLSSEHLKKIIQNSVDGHDSAEDAMVCMELLHFKLREDLKSR